MNILKYFFLIAIFVGCTDNILDTPEKAYSEPDKISQFEIIKHISILNTHWTLKKESRLKSNVDEENSFIYSASYDDTTCEARFTSNPEIESFFYDQYFVFFTNSIDLESISDFNYDSNFNSDIQVKEADFYTFLVEDYTVFLIDILKPIDCPRNVSVKFWTN